MSEENKTTEQREEPTREEVLDYYREKIELAELRAELAELTQRMSAANLQDLKNHIEFAHIQNAMNPVEDPAPVETPKTESTPNVRKLKSDA